MACLARLKMLGLVLLALCLSIEMTGCRLSPQGQEAGWQPGGGGGQGPSAGLPGDLQLEIARAVAPSQAGSPGQETLATIELVPTLVLSENPSLSLDVRLGVRRRDIVLLEKVCEVDLRQRGSQRGSITWLGPDKVLFYAAYLGDLEAGCIAPLPVSVPCAFVDPSGRYIANWGPTDPSGERKGLSLYDLETDTTDTILTFSAADWGSGQTDIGVLPSAAWMSDSAILFDGPHDGRPAIYSFDLGTRKTAVWREKAWLAQSSGDGRFASYVTRDGWRPGTACRLMLVDLETGEEVAVPEATFPLETRILWDANSDAVAVIAPGQAILGRWAGGKWQTVRTLAVKGSPLEPQLQDGRLSFAELVRDEDGTPRGGIRRTLESTRR